MLTADVAVVGAGPAGAAAAVTLARAGAHVVVVDKASFPRDKCCGDGLTTGALRRLAALGLDAAAVPSWQPVEDVVVRSPSGRTVTFPLPRGDGLYGAVARRRDLDAALVALARDAGAEVRERTAVTAAGVAPDGRSVVLTAGGEEIRAHYALGADGMWSPLRKLFGAGEEGGYLGEWHAFRQYFRGVTGPAADRLLVWFDEALLPGYAWSFPLPGGTANVGFGILRRPGAPTKSMKPLWARVLDRDYVRDALGPDAQPEAPHCAWPIPARIGRTALTAGGGRVLFVGDAARATDPMTGEGIGQALETGIDAATALLTAGPDRPATAARCYEERVRAGLAVDHALAGALSRVLRSSRGARGAVRIAGASDWTRRHFARWLFEDYPRAVLATPHRWHRHLLSGPGARL